MEKDGSCIYYRNGLGRRFWGCWGFLAYMGNQAKGAVVFEG